MQGKVTSDAWTEVKGKLSGEGDLFSFIANKLKDTDLQHKVDTNSYTTVEQRGGNRNLSVVGPFT